MRLRILTKLAFGLAQFSGSRSDSRFLGGILKGSNLFAWQPGPHRVGLLTAQELVRQVDAVTWPEDPENLIPSLTRFCPD